MFKSIAHIPITIQLIETSERLREVQKSTLSQSDSNPHPPEVAWYDDLQDLPKRQPNDLTTPSSSLILLYAVS